MKAKTSFTPKNVHHIAQLANIPIKPEKEKDLTDSFNSMMTVVEELKAMDTKNVEPTSQVTGLVNVFREDKVEEKRMLSQADALSNAKATHNGYFVVDAILEES